MLNISNKSIGNKIDLNDYKSGKKVADRKYYRVFNWLSIIFLIGICAAMFLPWTQNINGKGYVTTLRPDQRPQSIQSPIAGRLEQWFVTEGDFVQQGDTILQISEIKSDYFDDKLVERTGDQIGAKKESINAYNQKVNALSKQIKALKKERSLKLEQAENKLLQSRLKVKSDSIDLIAIINKRNISKNQYDRTFMLQQEGLKATKDVEEKKIKLQESEAKVVSQQNKLLESKNKVINADIEISRIKATYDDKISKSESNIYTAKSNKQTAIAEVSKLENKKSNYEKRFELQYVRAPQSGYINKAIKSGIGETFKGGESLVKIMPSSYELAVETYVKPIDLPLIHIDEKVRIQFDGWPSIVFSGWENASFGTFGGKVVAIENFISENGMYRVLIAPDKNDKHKWPEAIRIGSGAKTLALLEDVPIWYELWRQLNGFPPNYYKPGKEESIKKKPKIKKK